MWGQAMEGFLGQHYKTLCCNTWGWNVGRTWGFCQAESWRHVHTEHVWGSHCLKNT